MGVELNGSGRVPSLVALQPSNVLFLTWKTDHWLPRAAPAPLMKLPVKTESSMVTFCVAFGLKDPCGEQ